MRVHLESTVRSLLRAVTIGEISVSHVENLTQNLTTRLNVEAERSDRAANRLSAL
jgi:hypothetical protein